MKYVEAVADSLRLCFIGESCGRTPEQHGQRLRDDMPPELWVDQSECPICNPPEPVLTVNEMEVGEEFIYGKEVWLKGLNHILRWTGRGDSLSRCHATGHLWPRIRYNKHKPITMGGLEEAPMLSVAIGPDGSAWQKLCISGWFASGNGTQCTDKWVSELGVIAIYPPMEGR
jgi:hypothetical protein